MFPLTTAVKTALKIWRNLDREAFALPSNETKTVEKRGNSHAAHAGATHQPDGPRPGTGLLGDVNLSDPRCVKYRQQRLIARAIRVRFRLARFPE